MQPNVVAVEKNWLPLKNFNASLLEKESFKSSNVTISQPDQANFKSGNLATKYQTDAGS